MKDILKSEKFIILLITMIIFSFSYFENISTIIIHTMSFLILLEVVRTIYEYLVNSNHRIKLRYIIDGSILFGIRELFVGWITIKTDLILGLILVFVSIILIGILIFFRKKVIENSPDYIERCNSCKLPGKYED